MARPLPRSSSRIWWNRSWPYRIFLLRELSAVFKLGDHSSGAWPTHEPPDLGAKLVGVIEGCVAQTH